MCGCVCYISICACVSVLRVQGEAKIVHMNTRNERQRTGRGHTAYRYILTMLITSHHSIRERGSLVAWSQGKTP